MRLIAAFMAFALLASPALAARGGGGAGMVETFQNGLQYVCVSALAAIAVFAALSFAAEIGRKAMRRLRSVTLAVWLCIAAASSVILGSDKTNGVLQAILPFGPQIQVVQLPQVQPVVPPSAPPLAAPSPRASADMPFRARAWNRRGAWNDSFRCAFPGEWVFPHGTGHLDRVEVCSQGRILPRYGSTNVIVSIGVPLQIVNPLTSFGCGTTDRDSYVFAWTNAVIGRVSREAVANAETIDASIELFRNGDIAITTNGVTELRPRELPFPRDGYGQDDEWVAANFTNATDILAVGYPQWVDAQVGEGLTNGLYKFTATVPDDPPETIQLVVGDYSVAVTNAGEYVFLLDKGVDYEYGTVPFMANATYSVVDDIPQTRGGTPSPDPEGQTPTWSVDGGRYGIAPQTESVFGRVLWLPLFFGSPDVAHIGPGDGPLAFSANFADCRTEPAATYSWSASPGITVQSPNAKTTAISFNSMPSWAVASVSVTATFGTNTLVSALGGMTYGTNDVPELSSSITVQNVHFINGGGRPERVYPVSVALYSPVETNCIVGVEHEGSDGALFWTDAEATQPLQSLSGISLSAVTEQGGGSPYTFYMTSPNVGSGSFTAMFALPSGETRGVGKTYRAIEPIRKLVCNEIDPLFPCVFNPSRLVYGHPARLKVGARGNFTPDDVLWRVVSGPATVARGEDGFGTPDWTATVTATASSGEVVVEARFNEDAIQPRFVLPIVQMRTLPVRAFVVSANNKPVMSADDIQRKVDYANMVFTQVGIGLNLLSISNDVGSASDLVVSKMQTYTNANGRVCKAISAQALTLMNTYSIGDCLELYFVEEIVNERVLAFFSPWGIVVSRRATDHVVAHEIGHALGLMDCYSKRKGNMVSIASGHLPVTSEFFTNRILDWGVESGRGFYEVSDTMSAVMTRLLMFGEDGSNESIDIPDGAVYSLKKKATSPLHTFFSNVGAGNMKTNISEVYSR